MGKLRSVPLLFKGTQDNPIPVDASFYARVSEWCERNFAEPPDLKHYARTYVVIEEGETGELLEIHHVSFFRYTPDISGFRSVGPFAKQATVLAHDRWQTYFADNGWAGQDVMIWIDEQEQPEQQCPNRDGSVKEFQLRPAKRMLVKVR